MTGRASGRILAALLAAILSGCLTWTMPVGDDDDSAGDDDDATADDDDSTGDDDDSTGDDDDATGDDDDSTEPIPLEANAAVTVVNASAVEDATSNPGGVAAAAFASQLISPSAEEAVYEDVVGFPILTFADVGGFRESAGDQYAPNYITGTDDLVIQSTSGVETILEPATSGWNAGNLSSMPVSVGEAWEVTVPAGPFAGTWPGPEMPLPPEVVSDRLLGGNLFLHPDVDTEIRITSSEDGTDEAIGFLSGFDSGALANRTYGPDEGSIRVEGTGHLAPGEFAQLFVQRTRRELVEIGERSLILASAWFGTAQVLALGDDDVFLRPQTTPDWFDPPGTQVLLDVEPPILDEGQSYTVQFQSGAPEVVGLYSGGVLDVAVDPGEIGFGWTGIEIALESGGEGQGAIEIGGAPPSCDGSESTPNDTQADAEVFSIGQVVCGTIDPAGDVDMFRFQTTLGVTYRFETFARRLGSTADTIITVYDQQGGQLASNDDYFGRDSRVDVTVEQTGPIFVEVRDFDAAQEGPDAFWRLATTTTP